MQMITKVAICPRWGRTGLGQASGSCVDLRYLIGQCVAMELHSALCSEGMTAGFCFII